MNLAEQEFTGGNWMFRGQDRRFRDNEGKDVLLPHIGRDNARRSPTGTGVGQQRYKLEDEEQLLARFRRQAVPYITYQPASQIEWLVVGRHHGLPTRLLDWTENPLAAAFFAVKGMGAFEGENPGPAVVYAVRKPGLVSKEFHDNPFAMPHVSLYRPPYLTARIPAQRSLVTIHSTPPTTPYPLTRDDARIEVPRRKYCGRIKVTLNNCGINQETLFPDLDGLAGSLAWQYKWFQLS